MLIMTSKDYHTRDVGSDVNVADESDGEDEA